MKLNEIMHWELSTLPAKLELMSLQAYSLSLELRPETSVFSREVSAGLGWLPGTLQGDRKGRRWPWALQTCQLPLGGLILWLLLITTIMVDSGSHSSHQSFLAWTEPFPFDFPI